MRHPNCLEILSVQLCHMNNQILFMSSALFCRLLFLLQHRFLLKSFTAIVVWCEARHGDENFRHFYPCIGASEEGFVWGTLSSLEAFCTAGPAEERAYPCLSCLTIDPISLKMYSNFTPARLILFAFISVVLECMKSQLLEIHKYTLWCVHEVF